MGEITAIVTSLNWAKDGKNFQENLHSKEYFCSNACILLFCIADCKSDVSCWFSKIFLKCEYINENVKNIKSKCVSKIVDFKALENSQKKAYYGLFFFWNLQDNPTTLITQNHP